MAKVYSYDQLSTKTEDILTKYYLFKSAAFDIKASKGHFDSRFKAKLNHDQNFSASLKYSQKFFTFEHKRTTFKTFSYLLTFTPALVENTLKLMLNLKGNNEDKIDSSLSLEFQKKNELVLKFEGFLQKKTANFNFCWNLRSFLVGAEIKVCPEGILHLGTALALRGENLKLILDHQTSELAPGSLRVFLKHQVNPDLTLVSKVSSNMKSKSNNIQVGCSYLIDSRHVFKVKVENEGKVALALVKRFDENLLCSVSSGFDLLNLNSFGSSGHLLGLRLEYNNKT
jgi:hypothetical protein